jgi:environmental stress-induced protein Ves
MNWKLVSLDTAPPQPWRNGGGVTRELLAWPGAADWQVRISVADVQAAGPFSRFDGIERGFVVLSGQGVVLRDEGGKHRLTRTSEPFRFDGGEPVDCTLLGGPTRDFNLMAPPGRSVVRRVRGSAGVRTEGRRLLACYAHELPARLMVAGADLRIPPYHLAWVLTDGPASGAIEARDALWMEVTA